MGWLPRTSLAQCACNNRIGSWVLAGINCSTQQAFFLDAPSLFYFSLTFSMTPNEDHNWKFAQCFGDKGDSDDITEGSFSIFALQRHANFIYNSTTTTIVFTFSLFYIGSRHNLDSRIRPYGWLFGNRRQGWTCCFIWKKWQCKAIKWYILIAKGWLKACQ